MYIHTCIHTYIYIYIQTSFPSYLLGNVLPHPPNICNPSASREKTDAGVGKVLVAAASGSDPVPAPHVSRPTPGNGWSIPDCREPQEYTRNMIGVYTDLSHVYSFCIPAMFLSFPVHGTRLNPFSPEMSGWFEVPGLGFGESRSPCGAWLPDAWGPSILDRVIWHGIVYGIVWYSMVKNPNSALECSIWCRLKNPKMDVPLGSARGSESGLLLVGLLWYGLGQVVFKPMGEP